MATIAINDLDINQELDSNALKNIFGGRWVRRTYYRTVYRRYSYTVRVRRYYTATVRKWASRTVRQAYSKWVWV